MRAAHESVRLTNQRAEQRNPSTLPVCRIALSTPAAIPERDFFHTAEQRRGERRHQQTKPAADDHELRNCSCIGLSVRSPTQK